MNKNIEIPGDFNVLIHGQFYTPLDQSTINLNKMTSRVYLSLYKPNKLLLAKNTLQNINPAVTKVFPIV